MGLTPPVVVINQTKGKCMVQQGITGETPSSHERHCGNYPEIGKRIARLVWMRISIAK